MLISRKKKFVFIHIPKNAGSTIRTILSPYASSQAGTHFHAGARDLSLPDIYYKFAFVRDPWERMVSIYEFTKKRYNETPDAYKHMAGYNQLNWEFSDWLLKGSMWEGNFKANIIPSVQRRSQEYYVNDEAGNQLVDFIGRVDNFNNDIQTVLNHLGIPAVDIPIINSTSYNDYRSYYTQKEIDFISEHFRWEIGKYGYSF